MGDEIVVPVSVRAEAAPTGGVMLDIRLPCCPALVLELPADAARTVMREMAAALGDGFERTFTTEAARG